MKAQSNVANLLAKIAGDPGAENVTPKNMKEYYLNEIAENGSGGGGALVVTKTNNALDKTYAEIAAAYGSGTLVMLKDTRYGAQILRYLDGISYDEIQSKYFVTFTYRADEEESPSTYTYASSTENGTLTPYYPG